MLLPLCNTLYFFFQEKHDKVFRLKWNDIYNTCLNGSGKIEQINTYMKETDKAKKDGKYSWSFWNS